MEKPHEHPRGRYRHDQGRKKHSIHSKQEIQQPPRHVPSAGAIDGGGSRFTGIFRTSTTRRSLRLHRPAEGFQGLSAGRRGIGQPRRLRAGRRRSWQSQDPTGGKRPATQIADLLQDTHQRQAEPAVRRQALHPVAAAVRGVRSGALRSQPRALSGRLPGAQAGQRTGAGPHRRPQLAGERRAGRLPQPSGAVPATGGVLQRS
ncbi:hypothetical protein D9M69_410830 [compost metagenome]